MAWAGKTTYVIVRQNKKQRNSYKAVREIVCAFRTDCEIYATETYSKLCSVEQKRQTDPNNELVLFKQVAL